MLRTLARLAATLVLGAVLLTWFVLGADRGWTKTSVTTMQTDEITGLQFPVIENRFVPGVDFVAVGLGASLTLFALSFIPTKRKP